MMFKKSALFALVSGCVLLLSTSGFAQDDEGGLGLGGGDTFAGEDEGSPLDAEGDSGDDYEARPTNEGGGGEASIGGPLLLTQHTMQFGGTIGLTIDGSVKGDDAAGGSFTFAPEAGYFVIDNLELLLVLGLNIPFGDFQLAHYPTESDTYWNNAAKEIMFAFGARYIFDFDILGVYVGGLFGMNFSIIGDDTFSSVLLSIPGGILVPFNPHIALDAGVRLNMYFGVGDNDVICIDVPFAYFGLQGFFNLFGG